MDRESVINAAHKVWKETVLRGGSAEQATAEAVETAIDMVEKARAAPALSHTSLSPRSEPRISKAEAIKWLDRVAVYFERLDTGGEDKVFWAKVSNSAAAKKIAALVNERCNDT